ncbi:glycosyltransferase family 39 protein [Massilia sp. TS11]|uniref:ArnT family glycosyltransferase n=1 Tax=Massilia sp. TS11 TaxID=2908003 RepID=UPI001EDAA62A|nr:glycosyltransferase family 39 protein [Massilia sp. TS11]MCG2583044.1 glycosyltransferase family 39 protein [Massilia sp. TS11]
MNELHTSKTLAWSLLAAFILFTLYALGIRALVPPDEGRYAEMAREMFANGDWITTRLNGIKYFEKPPLQTWMNALSFAAFGLGEWQARLWTGVCAILGVLLTGYTGRRVFNQRVGFYAALVLGSCFYWVACGQIDSLDMSLSAMMTIALCALLLAQRDNADARQRCHWMLVCWAGMALAVLAKGLIGIVIPGAVLVLYTLATRDWGLWTRLHLGKGLLLFFAIAAPWFVLVARINPEQPHFFFVHEHFERFLLKEHHREGPWYTFFVLLAIGAVPWLGVLLQSLRHGLQREHTRFRPRLMLFIWLVFIVLFFTKSSSKLPGYILPVFPALALLTAGYLEQGSRRSRMLTGVLTALAGVVLLALVPNMGRFAYYPADLHLLQAWQPWVLAAGFIALAGGAFATLAARQLQRDLGVVALAIAGFGATQLVLAGSDGYGRLRSGIDMVPVIQAEATPATPIYSVAIYEQSLTFYLRRTVTLVNYVDEFRFGLEQEPGRAIARIEDWASQWRAQAAAGQKALAIISPEAYAKMQAQDLPMRLLARDTRRLVIANL